MLITRSTFRCSMSSGAVEQSDVHRAKDVLEQLGASATRHDDTGTSVLIAFEYSVITFD